MSIITLHRLVGPDLRRKRNVWGRAFAGSYEDFDLFTLSNPLLVRTVMVAIVLWGHVCSEWLLFMFLSAICALLSRFLALLYHTDSDADAGSYFEACVILAAPCLLKSTPCAPHYKRIPSRKPGNTTSTNQRAA
jgi:hypothetical protein